MFWYLFGSRKAYDELKARLDRIEVQLPATVAALENAADLYNRAAARAERSKPRNGGTDPDSAHSIEEIRKRRGGF